MTTNRSMTPAESRRIKPANPDPEWRDRAACRYDGNDIAGERAQLALFHEDAWNGKDYAEHHGTPGPRLPLAKAFCRGCPVSEECLWEALIDDVRYGILGGLTPRERYVLRRRLAL